MCVRSMRCREHPAPCRRCFPWCALPVRRPPTEGHPLTPRTIVITGASDGIGAAAARTLAKAGEQVVVVGRSAEKTRALAAEIGADHYLADFAELAQVRDLAENLKAKYPRIA